MLRAAAVAGFILVLISAAVVGSLWLQGAYNEAPVADQPECDLLAGPCDWQTEAGHWQADLKILGDQGQGAEYQLSIRAPLAPERFLAVLRGESMYMGEYPVPLRQIEPGRYSAKFTAPLCTTGSRMVWRIDLQKGQQPMFKTPPLRLVFQAQDHRDG
ncbi:hypothetical protein GCM10011533_27240 [Streptosporangium jomthongense]|uniref:Uncharacterized protein n=1 Tax=Marinobacter aromaticivorans TaxID=1494078 RepID=A0ABW2IX18_9GAMM|nr:hypothetical protein [Marinobacter aromaticivorans]GGE73383.1 hypothetical protein GCM10011533_27240 [Streptosporangium jomthongense]